MWYGSLQCLQVPIDWQNHGVTNIFSFVFLSTNPTYLKPEKCAPKLRLQCCDWGRSVLFKCKNCAADSAAIEVDLCFLNAVDSAATEVDLCFLNPEWTPSSGGSGCAAGGRLPLTLRWRYTSFINLCGKNPESTGWKTSPRSPRSLDYKSTDFTTKIITFCSKYIFLRCVISGYESLGNHIIKIWRWGSDPFPWEFDAKTIISIKNNEITGFIRVLWGLVRGGT